jgi:Icc protein
MLIYSDVNHRIILQLELCANQVTQSINKRDLLKSIGLLAASQFLPNNKVNASETILSNQNPKRVLRVAHITDIHIGDAKNAKSGLIKCLHHIQSLNDKVDIIFNGGDTIEDALFKSKSQVKNQWDLWHSVLNNECSLKMDSCLGNHDIWGLYTEKKDLLYGKNFALEMMKMDKTYKSFDINGWHFIFLDSTQKKKNGLWYTAKLGEEQSDWLKNDLASVHPNTPVMVMSHIPILCANVFLDNVKIKYGKFQVPGSWMHTDVKEIVSIFNQHKNVKLCVSGHIHLYDNVSYNGVTYSCNGAVSGDWWKNELYHETPAGYALIDLFDDGSFTNTYMDYNTPK